jgi:hypothetical protein
MHQEITLTTTEIQATHEATQHIPEPLDVRLSKLTTPGNPTVLSLAWDEQDGLHATLILDGHIHKS